MAILWNQNRATSARVRVRNGGVCEGRPRVHPRGDPDLRPPVLHAPRLAPPFSAPGNERKDVSFPPAATVAALSTMDFANKAIGY